MSLPASDRVQPTPHPRTLGWIGTTALAMGGSNQSLFLMAALFAGQGSIPGQGSAAVPLLIVGLIVSWAAAPAWTELVLMWPNRVGGISAACAEAFKPYSPVLSALTGSCYWWGWVPTCGLTAVLSAAAIQQWYLPGLPVELVACALVAFFTVVNLCGIKWVVRLAVPVATASAGLALISSIGSVFSGSVDWRQATDFSLNSPFEGLFGDVTSIMAGLYLIGFAAPAFEAAACHVGETIDPDRNLPRAMFASGAMAGMYFFVLPVVWLGVVGPGPLGMQLALVLGPTFAPLLGGLGKSAAIWFMMMNMFHGTLQPLAGAARTLSQLSEDGLLPRFLAKRTSTDCPWAATLLTGGSATLFILSGYPLWFIAAANFTYLISICMPNVAAWLLRRDQPEAERPYRAPRGTIMLGVASAGFWLLTAVLGFQQFGLPTVLCGLALAYSGAALYAWRMMEDRRLQGLPLIPQTLHLKLTGAMLFVLVLDGAGYLLAVESVPHAQSTLATVLEDIFVVVALLTISVGLVLPGMITHSAEQVSEAARRLASGTLTDFSHAMAALGRGDLDAAHASVDIAPVRITSRDELGEMGHSFNILQDKVQDAAYGLDRARESLRAARTELMARHHEIAHLAHHDALTDLPNRTALSLRFESAIERAAADGGSFAVLSVDLDHFKEANDVFGHAAGDELLCAIADRLKLATDGSFIARVGGDEFIILSEGGDSELKAKELADRVFKAVSGDISVRGQQISISVSVGAALYPRDGSDVASLMANSDAALYRAKADGRRMLQVFDPEMDRQTRERYALQHDLRTAVAHQELLLHYQPQARIDGTICGFEALARWRHPKRGLVSPATFIPLAEQDGSIVEIGEWTLREACREAASWPSPLQIAVNLSPVQFRFGDLASLVHSILFDTGLAPGRLELEITEGVLIRDAQTALTILRRLKSLGVKIAMDDFGTGYASLASLQSFPFDKIKIDRSFVSGVAGNGQSAAIVRSILTLGAALGMPVIAEGVETEEELDFLRAEGCAEIQGYLLGKPQMIEIYAEQISGRGGRFDYREIKSPALLGRGKIKVGL
ncbi:amino acid permease [Hansschlegelia quercus]|uniref:Amino acid permease n=2 Tax=Hansschlegelia quercus TaxID=2528245 RepID=A0A4Q9GID8_9HYPH|nr:amino acid permease [Hansschlegelia quercus]TBN51723.1 amino acid permease [Hansschlegelia quercus]